MALEDGIRDRVIMLGGKVGGVDCPDCEYRSLDVALPAHETTDVRCPDCGSTILTEDQRSRLREADKL